MIKIKSKLSEKKEFINLTPLIDIVFLLLIFFMLTSNFIEKEGINIKLPESTAKTSVNKEIITVYITKDNKIYFKGGFVNDSEIYEKLKDALKKSDSRIIMLKADKNSRMEIAVKILGIAKSLGAKKLIIATKGIKR